MKKKILFIVPLPPPVHGSSIVSQCIKNSKVIQERFDCDFINLSTSRQIDEIGTISAVKLWRFFASYFILIYKLLFRKYDLCYLAITCYGIGFLKDAPFVIICKIFRRKIVIHQHNKGMSRYVDRIFYKWLFTLVYQNTNVILLSWKLYEDIVKIVKREQVFICPNGIPFEMNKPIQRSNSIPQLLFLSNLMETKGVFILLDACKSLHESGYKFTCKFVGGETKEINSKKFSEEVKKRSLESCVSYVGRKYGKEKIKEFITSDIFVQPTYDDCFPLTLLEAMQLNLPVISTDQGAIAEMIEDGKTGLICKTKNSEDLVIKIKQLFDNPQLRLQFGNAGYDRFMTKYTLAHFEEHITACLSAIK